MLEKSVLQGYIIILQYCHSLTTCQTEEGVTIGKVTQWMYAKWATN